MTTDTQLPEVARGEIATQVRASDPRIEHFRQKFLAKPASAEPSAKRAAREAELHKLAAALNTQLKKSRDVRPILVIMEGPDGSGKSSTFERLKPAFEGARVVELHSFAAPPKNAEDVHWLKRFFDNLPEKGAVMFWDRSYYGRAVYEPHYKLIDKAQLKISLEEINAFERMLRAHVRIVKFYFDVPSRKIASTLGKREAIDPAKLADSDYSSFRDRKIIKRYYERAIARTSKAVPWHVIPMRNRAAGRAAMLRILTDTLT